MFSYLDHDKSKFAHRDTRTQNRKHKLYLPFWKSGRETIAPANEAHKARMADYRDFKKSLSKRGKYTPKEKGQQCYRLKGDLIRATM